jgi:TolB-like protein/DNA-binding winged helix-turn-helix (wHTH) protein/Tfp pilus assembly protein PilF
LKLQVRLPLHIVDIASDELRSSSGECVELRPRSFAVLRLLAENAGRLVGKDEIMAKVWDDVAVTEDSLTQCIADIRKAISDEERRVLRTVSRKGYILVPSQGFTERPLRMPDRPALAVRPFLSLTEQSEIALGQGLSCELICELARNRDLRVLSRDSAHAFDGQQKTPQEIGQLLGVRYLVEGMAQRSNGTMIIDVQLVDTRDNSIVWGDRFSATSADIPQVRWSIVEKIASTLHSAMREAEEQIALSRAPRDLDVYELTLRGIALKHRFSADAFRAGRSDMEEAIRRDPNYSPAWAYLAWLNAIDISMQLTGEWPPTRVEEVITQFRRAIELDPNLPAAYQGLSMTLAMLVGDVSQAVSVARRAVQLGPSDADGLLFLALALLEAGELEEASVAAAKAIELNPMRPPHFCYFHGRVLCANGHYQAALDRLDECLLKAPTFWGAGIYRVECLVGLGQIEAAKSALAKYLADGRPIIPPRAPAVVSHFLAALHSAGWRPTVAAERAAG